ncbi:MULTISPECIES: NADH-quinone oxidoreductase subunit C [unclassified Saccharopolyspora]|uniref:hydrogenase large subunit n=1 Tax=unclassified Saccharopolyspora TaxID=2646250 RepID=UPI001CD40886|nr:MULTISPECIES: NADH-quinone oxidoreductase subunit C [unclassified Saccharopolyspora]MCA1186224.1 NADH-quinone oxidoreductase subunit C [Saccharopolyspora sp. 6T]MCA1194640.1 NADH-quinone oxidoreductase subunit C [Saccharopolyspora sp. 6V]MCA1229031.1 NADH-quinone oxidoreductase subunit C [Saccharopolyspora sp. 6M]MCA1278426.1 NADH-quinone oxidoreductase subunit C [Saccharopolyspora sp. 7B]
MTLPDSADGEPRGHRRTALIITPDAVYAQVERLLTAGYRIAMIAGHDDGQLLRAVYLFTCADDDRRVELQVPVDRADPHLPSVAGLSFPAGRFEREMRDLFGIVPDGHPLPRRLVRHFHWPQGWYPMRQDAGEAPEFGAVDGPYPFRAVEGNGVHEIPVGPVHAGLIEPGHFRFSVVGETILNLKARLWFVHRGIEKQFQGLRPDEGLSLAEHISGDTSVGHALAYCQAVEDAASVRVPLAALRIRAVLLELERLYNHVTDLGALCNDVGHGVLNSHAGRLRERLLRMNDDVTGHRLLRGGVRVGGAVVRKLPDLAALAAVKDEAGQLHDLALGHSVVRDRFAGTAVLSSQQAFDLGTLGYVARASGLEVDARWDHPVLSPPQQRLHYEQTGGDVLARFSGRAAEVSQSIDMIAHLAEQIDGRVSATSGCVDEPDGLGGSGVGITEGWRGTIVHRVELKMNGRLSRVKIVDPSFFNWPALPVALNNTIVPDFPLVNKSFNLSYAGNDL